MVLNTATLGRPNDGSALSVGPLSAAGRGGLDCQWFRDPYPVRTFSLHRREPLGVLLACFLFRGPRSAPTKRFTYFIIHYLPTGVLGLVIAAIFSAAMGTLAGSLNSSASTIVNDLYRPFTGRSDERHLLRVRAR